MIQAQKWRPIGGARMNGEIFARIFLVMRAFAFANNITFAFLPIQATQYRETQGMIDLHVLLEASSSKPFQSVQVRVLSDHVVLQHVLGEFTEEQAEAMLQECGLEPLE